MIQEFVASLPPGANEVGRTPLADLATWQHVWTVAAAVRRSLELRQAVSLEDC
jgi:hypothetical protein